MSKVITVSRELGSGGREVGLRLAKNSAFLFTIKNLSPWRPRTAISRKIFSMRTMK